MTSVNTREWLPLPQRPTRPWYCNLLVSIPNGIVPSVWSMYNALDYIRSIVGCHLAFMIYSGAFARCWKVLTLDITMSVGITAGTGQGAVESPLMQGFHQQRVTSSKKILSLHALFHNIKRCRRISIGLNAQRIDSSWFLHPDAPGYVACSIISAKYFSRTTKYMNKKVACNLSAKKVSK